MCKCPKRWPLKSKRVAFEGESSVALISKEKWAASADDKQILVAPVVKVGKQRTRSTIENADSCLFGYIFKGSVTKIAVQPIGQPGRLTDIQVVKSVAIKVAGRDAVVAVDIDPTSAIENGAPIIKAPEHLMFVRVVAA